MKNKVVSMKEAVSGLVRDGDTVVIEGFTHLICFAAGHEIIRQGRKNLTLARLDDLPPRFFDDMAGDSSDYDSSIIAESLRAQPSDKAADDMISRLQQHWLPFDKAMRAVILSGRVGLARMRPVWREQLRARYLGTAIATDSMDMVDWFLARHPWNGDAWESRAPMLIALQTSDAMALRFVANNSTGRPLVDTIISAGHYPVCYPRLVRLFPGVAEQTAEFIKDTHAVPMTAVSYGNINE